MTTRRGFLSLLLAAPFAAPAVVKAAAAERYSGYARGISGAFAQQIPSAVDMVSKRLPLEHGPLSFAVDTSEIQTKLNEMVRIAKAAVQSVTASPFDDPHDPVPDYFC